MRPEVGREELDHGQRQLREHSQPPEQLCWRISWNTSAAVVAPTQQLPAIRTEVSLTTGGGFEP